MFQREMLFIFDIDELQPLINELVTLTNNIMKAHAKDDFIDSLRFPNTYIPWDWTVTNASINKKIAKVFRKKNEVELRREFLLGEAEKKMMEDVEEELDEWNEMLEV